MPLPKDRLLGRYEIRSLLGKGGMGEVYLAQDTTMRRPVAVKLLPTEFTQHPERLRRFKREAYATSALNHPNLLTVHEIGEDNGLHFIVAEYIEGESLRQRIRRTQMELRGVLDVAQQVASALVAAHEAGIVHRDIKPENIMLRRDSYVKVLDFGLAKLTEQQTPALDTEAPTTPLVNTNPGAVMGTSSYMSPEQARGLDVDARTDIWSLGVVLYEMLTRHLPFAGETASDMIAAILKSNPAPLAEDNAPPELQRIVRKALQKSADERYQTVKDLLIDLKNLKRELEFAEELERSATPPFAKAANISTNRSSQNAATAIQAAVSTQNSIQPQISSAEYVSSEIKKHKFVAVVILGLVVALIIGGYFFLSTKRTTSFNSIAVLPFVNASGDIETEFLSDGISETLINNFTKIPSLRVTARSTAFRYKGRDVDLQKIGRELNVSTILTGKVLQRGDSLSIQVDLINMTDGSQIWGNQYNGKTSEILDVQQRIAHDVSESLKWKLSGAQQRQMVKNYTHNAEAYQLYLRGRFYWNKRTAENIRKAIEQFREAANRDPNYAVAYVGLADCYVLLEELAGIPASETLPQAKAFATRALQIDESLAEAHASLGLINSMLWRWSEAEREYKRAIELNPNYPTAHHWYSNYLRDTGRFDEALAEIKRAQELDPLSIVINVNVGKVYYLKGDTNSAIQEIKKTIELDPHFPSAHTILGSMYLKQGRNNEALAELQKGVELSGRASGSLGFLGYASAVSGKRSEAVAIIKELKETYAKREAIGQNIAMIYVGLGENDQALVWLNRDFYAHSGELPGSRWELPFEPLRSDPRFQDLVRRVGLAP